MFFLFYENQVEKFLKSMITPALGETVESNLAIEIGDSPWEEKRSSIVRVDFFLPKGCYRLGYKPNTVIETKNRLTSGSLMMAYQLLERLRRSGRDVSEILVYYFGEEEEPLEAENKHRQFGYFEGVRAIDFNQLLLEYTKSKPQPVKRDYDWRKRSARHLEEAASVFSQGKNTLFVGAGVSCSAKMPDWEKLLKRVGDALVAKGRISATQMASLPKDSFNSDLVLARLLKMVNSDGRKDDDCENEFVQLIRAALYGSYFEPTSPLLESLVNVIYHGKVEAVISYNYDDLLESALQADPIHLPVSPVDKENRPAAGTLPIMHVHGFLPQHVDPSYERNIVLSEETYHELYGDAFHWANVEQLHALTQSTCFFIGLSLKDPSIRRLLDIAQQRGTHDAEHYAFLCRPEYTNPRYTEKVLRDMGVNVIWYEDKNHTDLPPMVSKLI